MHADEEKFLERIEAEDSDESRLVFADWLEERNDSRAEFLRLEIKLHALGSDVKLPRHTTERQRFAELAKKIDPGWRLRVERRFGMGLPPAPAPAPPVEAPVGPPELVASPLAYSQKTTAQRLRDMDRSAFLFSAFLFLAAFGASGCVFETHLTCRGGRDGSCAIDTYGLFTTVSHVDLPNGELAEVFVDERSSRRYGGSATVQIATRTRGRIDLSGGQLWGSRFSQSDAAYASGALRRLRRDGPTSPTNDVDLWVGTSPLAVLIILGFVLTCLYVIGVTMKKAFRDA